MTDAMPAPAPSRRSAAPRDVFGIDSARAWDDGPYEAALRRTGVKPEFILRYRPAYAMDAAELGRARAAGLLVGAIWNRDQDGSLCAQDSYDLGYVEGTMACASWQRIGYPPGHMIIYDLETGFHPTGNFLWGFFDGVTHHGYVPFIYCNPQNGANHAAAYQYARQRSAAARVFTSEDEYRDKANLAITTFSLGAGWAQPIAGYEDDTLLWQYSENVDGVVDLDCARAACRRHFYGSATRTTLGIRTSLRAQPDAKSHDVADLAAGCIITFTGAVTPHFARITVVRGETQKRRDAKGLVGWVERAKLRTDVL